MASHLKPTVLSSANTELLISGVGRASSGPRRTSNTSLWLHTPLRSRKPAFAGRALISTANTFVLWSVGKGTRQLSTLKLSGTAVVTCCSYGYPNQLRIEVQQSLHKIEVISRRMDAVFDIQPDCHPADCPSTIGTSWQWGQFKWWQLQMYPRQQLLIGEWDGFTSSRVLTSPSLLPVR